MESNIKIVYEDSDLLVIEKPSGLVVHPGAGNEKTTVVSWFLEKYPGIENLAWPDPTRAGIVHRLDKDTSGLMILAKTPEALLKLQKQFQNHEIHKSYLALVLGKFDKPAGEITGFIGRDPNARRQQSLSSIHFDWQPGKKRESKTRYKVVKEYEYDHVILSLIEATLDTGRMHQIRVHFKSIGHPVIGDPIYNTKESRKLSKLLGADRQFLHSARLMAYSSELPDDLKNILNKLK